jgi:hypothetical protein
VGASEDLGSRLALELVDGGLCVLEAEQPLGAGVDVAPGQRPLLVERSSKEKASGASFSASR